jgi:hypothetical protein
MNSILPKPKHAVQHFHEEFIPTLLNEDHGPKDYSNLLSLSKSSPKESSRRKEIPVYGQRKDWIPKSMEVHFLKIDTLYIY